MSDKPDNADLKRAEELMAGAGLSTGVEAGIIMHECFETMVNGGFTEKQALWIVAMGIFGGLQGEEPEE